MKHNQNTAQMLIINSRDQTLFKIEFCACSLIKNGSCHAPTVGFTV